MRVFQLLLLVLILTSTGLIGSPTDPQQIFLQQTLLRESVPYISKLWDISVSLDASLSNIDDLYIDYHPRKAEPLNQALTGIAKFIQKQHHISIEWSYEDNGVILRKKENG